MTFEKIAKQIILGTAGHIDHGKTALIKALTGTDTDRLKEEKLRGITIVLGFAALDLPSGRHIGIVDVPGHERFVKNMVAGATGIDIVALVIAADDGIMPQTREHLEICDLLGISHGFVAVTKVDLVDKEWLELVIDDIQQFLQGTFLQDTPIIPVSSITGQGIPEILATLEKLCGEVEGRFPDGYLRLPVDRVFTIKGFGTVVTGTLISGKVSVGDNVMIYPTGIASKVRGIQVHNEAAETATAGLRTAINFQGLDKSVINRGAVVATPNTLKPTYMVDVWLRYLKSVEKPLKNRTKIRFHTGTSEVLGYVVLVDREEILPGEDAIVQCRLNAPVVVMRDDHFVIRSYSPIHTIGGGRIIDPLPQKYKRGRITARDMQPLLDGELESIVNYHMTKAGFEGITFTDLIIMTNQTERKLTQTFQHLLSVKRIILWDRENQVYINGVTFGNLKEIIQNILRAYHEKNPLKGGISKEELKSKLPGGINSKLFNLLVQDMIKEGLLIQVKDTIRLATHEVALEGDQYKIRRELEEIYLRSGLQPPYFKDLVNMISGTSKTATDILFHMVEEGVLIKVKDNLYFHKTAIERLKNELAAYLKTHNEITTPQFKDMTGASRKYTIPLLEYFDAIKLTLRIGDNRRLREH
jgi:selenocysteine-specific elongation factor